MPERANTLVRRSPVESGARSEGTAHPRLGAGPPLPGRAATAANTSPADTASPESSDRATATTVRVLGLLAALAGVEHGVGEIAQGSQAPPGLVFESWPDVAAFEPLDGEPAMSLVPDLLLSGVLSVAVALALGVVAWSRPAGRRSGALLVGLSLVLLVVGGGFGPPLLGGLAGLLATRTGSEPARRAGAVTRLAARSWPWPLVVATVAFLGLVPGTALLQAGLGVDSEGLVGVLTFTALTATGLAMWSARARDRVVGDGAPLP